MLGSVPARDREERRLRRARHPDVGSQRGGVTHDRDQADHRRGGRVRPQPGRSALGLRRGGAPRCSLTVVTTWHPPPLPMARRTGRCPRRATRSSRRRTPRALLERLTAELERRDPAVDVRTSIEEGHPAKVLIERSKEADLLVVGAPRPRGLRRNAAGLGQPAPRGPRGLPGGRRALTERASGRPTRLHPHQGLCRTPRCWTHCSYPR